jgi:hypothetical protein
VKVTVHTQRKNPRICVLLFESVYFMDSVGFESWLRNALGKTNVKADSIVALLVVKKGFESKEEVEALDDVELAKLGFRATDIRRVRECFQRTDELASPSVPSHINVSVVGAQLFGSGNIVIGSLSQRAATTMVLKSLPEIESAKEALKRRQESACQDMGSYIFLGVDFMEQMLQACEATVSVCAFEGPNCANEIVGTGFMVADGRYIMTCMHNITLDTNRRSYKDEVPDWKVASSTDWPDLDSYKLEFAEKRFFVAGFKSGDVMAGAGVKKLVFSPGNIILYPHLDAAVIKIENAKELNLPSVFFHKNMPLKTGERDMEARCFVVGHPKLSPNRPIDQKVVSMQLHNFLRRVEDPFVQYFTDTERGFSGGPVFVWTQRRLVAVAVHHTGQRLSESDRDDLMIRNNLFGYNEGTLLSAVLVELEKHHLWQGKVFSVEKPFSKFRDFRTFWHRFSVEI